MKLFLTITLFLTSLFAMAQVDSVGLKETMQKLDNALLAKNSTELESVLNKNLSYGHSNAWIQTKKDVMDDMQSGKMVYNKITNENVRIVSINDKLATVRTNTNVEGTVNGTAFQLKLSVLQVWVRSGKGWELMARQSVKM